MRKKKLIIFENLLPKPELKNVKSPDRIMNNPVSKNINQDQNEVVISPYIRFLAKNREIYYEELLQIEGTGLDNRITKDDLNNYIRSGRRFKQQNKLTEIKINYKPDDPAPSNGPPYIPGPGEEVVEMDRTRKLIATHMVNSKRISPHVTSMLEIDVTHLVQWRTNSKDEFYQKHGIKLTYTPVILIACIKALKDFPGINISVSGDNIIYKKYINIGVATALPDGNLIVPVIKEADKRSFVNIALHLSKLANKARSGKLRTIRYHWKYIYHYQSWSL